MRHSSDSKPKRGTTKNENAAGCFDRAVRASWCNWHPYAIWNHLDHISPINTPDRPQNIKEKEKDKERTIRNRTVAGMVGDWPVDDVVVTRGVAEAEVEELPLALLRGQALLGIFNIDMGLKIVRA